MQIYNMRYAFFTTYDYTLFLKQDGEESDAVLHCSPPIKYSTESGSGASLRECLLYLQSMVEKSDNFKQDSSPPWQFINNVGADPQGVQWYVKKRSTGENSAQYLARVRNALLKVDPEHVKAPVGTAQSNNLPDDFSKLDINPQNTQSQTEKTDRPRKVAFASKSQEFQQKSGPWSKGPPPSDKSERESSRS